MTSTNLRRACLAIAVATAPAVLAACSSLTFLAANVPARFGSYQATNDVRYGSLERQSLDVYAPKERTSDDLRPVIIFVHGGNWVSGAKSNYRFVADTLTASGYLTVIPNYRLYPDAKFPAFVEDVAAAVTWTHAHAKEFGGDPNRLFLMGHSAGAQIVALLAFDTPYLAKAGAERTWIKGWIGLSGPYDFLPFEEQYLRDIFGPVANYPASQPINFVDARSPPALLIHGESDTVVLPKNSRNLAARLRSSGVAVRERYYEGMSHAEAVAALSVYLRGRREVVHEIEDFVQRPAIATSEPAAESAISNHAVAK